MVDRKARDEYAELLRHFSAGRMSTSEYDAATADIVTRDPAIHQIYESTVPLSDGHFWFPMTGRPALNKEVRRNIARCILFLHSDLEFEWPCTPWWRTVLNLFTLGIFGVFYPEDQPAGDPEIWPFFRQDNLNYSKEYPRLLSGRISA